ncbi:MAG: hypothetical protein ACK5Q5_02755 [Planctomycetaceae bacterium]
MVNRIASPKDQIRSLILQYLYDRNANATSARGKRGAAVKIGDMRRDLKAQHGLAREEVVANLRYLISQGWAEEQTQDRVVPTNGGRQIPSTTIYYAITAAGIDKIEGPGEYTPRDRFAGIVINANGRNTVTVGDGNQVNVKYEEPAEALASLADAIKHCDDLDPDQQMDLIADIDTIQSQLARSEPKPAVIKAAWESIEPLSKIASFASLVLNVGRQIGQFLV